MKTARTRRRRRWISAALAFLLAFASMVTAAHACTLEDLAPQGLAAAAAPMPGCDGGPAHAGSGANACALHCTASNLPDIQPAFAPALAFAQAPLRIDPPDAAAFEGRARRHDLAVLATAPPPLLRFARLLI